MSTTDALRKSVRVGFGALHLTKTHVKNIVDKLEKKGTLPAKDAEKLVQELLVTGRKRSVDIQKMVRQETERVVRLLGVATQKDIEKLRRELRR